MTVIRGPWRARPVTHQPIPPSAEYLGARERLGFQSYADAISRACPWCHARAGQPCQNTDGRRRNEPHEARRVAS